MKFFVIFAAILALAFAKSRNGIYELSEAIQNPNTDPAMIPYLEAALNDLILAAMTQPAVQPAPVAEPAVDTAAIDSLLEAIYNPNTDPAMIPFLEAALNELLVSINSPINPIPIVTVPAPAPVTSTPVLTTWSLQELSDAIQDPNTDPALLPHLEDGLNAIMSNLVSGDQQEYVVIALPAHLVPVTPVAPVPVVPTPVEQVVSPVEQVVAAEASPLVQIIVNVNREAAAAPVAPSPVVPSPVILPSPAPVVEWVPPTRPVPEHSIESVPVNPVDSIAVQPPQVVSPPQVIVVGPMNPVDVIAVAAPDVNPIDILHPVPAPAVSAVGVVGPLM